MCVKLSFLLSENLNYKLQHNKMLLHISSYTILQNQRGNCKTSISTATMNLLNQTLNYRCLYKSKGYWLTLKYKKRPKLELQQPMHLEGIHEDKSTNPRFIFKE